MHHINTIRKAQDFRQFGADEDDGNPLIRKFVQEAVNLRFGPDINAPGRLIQDQYLRFYRQPARENYLLLVAAGKVADFLLYGGRLDAQLLDLPRYRFALMLLADEVEPG